MSSPDLTTQTPSRPSSRNFEGHRATSPTVAVSRSIERLHNTYQVCRKHLEPLVREVRHASVIKGRPQNRVGRCEVVPDEVGTRVGDLRCLRLCRHGAMRVRRRSMVCAGRRRTRCNRLSRCLRHQASTLGYARQKTEDSQDFSRKEMIRPRRTLLVEHFKTRRSLTRAIIDRTLRSILLVTGIRQMSRCSQANRQSTKLSNKTLLRRPAAYFRHYDGRRDPSPLSDTVVDNSATIVRASLRASGTVRHLTPRPLLLRAILQNIR